MSSVGPLNLADADTRGFDPLDAGRYDAEVYKIEWDSTNNPEGKMPVGTPLMKIQFKVIDPMIGGEVVDQKRVVFTQFVIPPADYDPEKRKVMTGMVARFFIAIGEDEKKVKSAKFDPDFEDLIGRPCSITLSKEEYPKDSGEFQNRVKGVKPRSDDSSAAGGLL